MCHYYVGFSQIGSHFIDDNVETMNCECVVKNPQDLYSVGLRKYGTTVGHVLCVISCICTLFLIWHGGVIKPTLTGP